MNCSQCRSLLSALLAESLSETQQREVEAHLETCADCARELQILRGIGVTLSAMPTVTAPPDLRANVRAALQAQATARSARTFPFNWRVTPSFYAGGLAIATLCLIVLSRPFYNRPDLLLPTPTPVAAEQHADDSNLRQAPVKPNPAIKKSAQKPVASISGAVASAKPENFALRQPASPVPAPQSLPGFRPGATLPDIPAEPRIARSADKPQFAPPSAPEVANNSASSQPPAPSHLKARQQEAKVSSQLSKAKIPANAPPALPAASTPDNFSAAMRANRDDKLSIAAKDAVSDADATAHSPAAPAVTLALKPSAVQTIAGNTAAALSAGAETSKAAGLTARSTAPMQRFAPMTKAGAPTTPTADVPPVTNGLAPAGGNFGAQEAVPGVTPAPTRAYTLEVRAEADVSQANLKLFGPLLDKSAKETVVWQGKLTAKSPVSVPVQIAVSNKAQQFQATLEQIEADGQSKVLKSEIFTVP